MILALKIAAYIVGGYIALCMVLALIAVWAAKHLTGKFR